MFRSQGVSLARTIGELVLKYAAGMLAVWGIVSILHVSVGFWGILGITALLCLIAGLADI